MPKESASNGQVISKPIHKFAPHFQCRKCGALVFGLSENRNERQRILSRRSEKEPGILNLEAQKVISDNLYYEADSRKIKPFFRDGSCSQV